MRDLVYRIYEHRLAASLTETHKPRHVGVILDGNRRWARAAGEPDIATGHRRGADKIDEFLAWCAEADVEVVTLWLLSTDNLSRPAAELEPLLGIIERTARGLAADDQPWRLNPVGSLDLLPDRTAKLLKEAAEATVGKTGLLVNIAVGYGGRREIADAVRSLLVERSAQGASID